MKIVISSDYPKFIQLTSELNQGLTKRPYLRTMKTWIIIILLSFVPVKAWLQPVTTDMGFVDHESLHTYNFNADELGVYLEEVNDSIKNWLRDTSFAYPTSFVIQLNKSYAPSLLVLNSDSEPIAEYLSTKWDQLSDIRPLYLPQEVIMIIRDSSIIQGARNVILPWALKRQNVNTQQWNNKSYKENYLELIQWSSKINELLDIYELSAFKKTFDAAPPTDRKKRMEALVKDPLFYPIRRVFSLAKNGKLDYARLYIQQILQFEAPNTLLHYFIKELNWRLLVLKLKEKKALRKKYYGAIKQVHANNQAIIWMGLDTINNPSTDQYKTPELLTLYKSNFPLCKKQLNPYSKESAYDTALRNEMENLFIDAETFDSDFIRFGEIAIILEDYAFATDYFWMLAHDDKLPEKSEDAFFLYEYSLYRQGLLSELSKKEEKPFKKYGKQLKKVMKRSEAYRGY